MYSDSNFQVQVDDLISTIETLRQDTVNRKIVAIAGPPNAGKTTLADLISGGLPKSSVVSMDSFHLDNSILIEKGLVARKGAPETFDFFGFAHLITRLEEKKEIYVPAFDRKLDKTTNCCHIIPYSHDVVIVEGNYLLLDEPNWRDLDALWDLRVFIDLSVSQIRKRALERWAKLHIPVKKAIQWVENNDLPNAERILKKRLPEDVLIKA